MTPESPPPLARTTRLDKHRAYLRSIGQPSMTTEIHDVQRKLRRFYFSGGMSTTEMREQSGVARDTITSLIYGARRRRDRNPVTHMHASVLAKLDLIQYVPPPGDTNRGGARVPAHGKRRRLQALTAIGFTGTFLASELDMGEYGARNLSLFIHGAKGRVYTYGSSAMRVALLYDKLRDANPADFGIAPDRTKSTMTYARKSGFASPSCWDDDTIDDPDAIPEWTGMCGTEEGYRIHMRETLAGRPTPPCLPCRTVVESKMAEGMTGGPLLFRRERFIELMEERGTNVRRLSAMTGLNRDSVYRWKLGNYAPRYRGHIETMAKALDCDISELLDETAAEAATQALAEPGQFNRFAVRALLEQAGVSQNKAAQVVGASHTAFNNWLAGRSRPSEKTKLKLLADYLGVPVEVFYS